MNATTYPNTDLISILLIRLSEKTLRIVVPLALVLIFMILYFQFRSAVTTAMVFSGIYPVDSSDFEALKVAGGLA